MNRWIRVILCNLTGLVGITAVAGGVTLVAATATPLQSGGFLPNEALLDGSPFSSYLIPGLVLAVVVGGTHTAASVLLGRASRSGAPATAIGGFGLLIWIFVQMIYIPFSPLQPVYFAAGLAELGLVLIGLGLARRRGVAAS